MSKVFISYRRSDSMGIAHKIADHLIGKLGRERIFFDKEGLRDGENWFATIDEELKQCDILLMVCGPSWRSSFRFDSRDVVLWEVWRAIARDLWIIPIVFDAEYLSADGQPYQHAPTPHAGAVYEYIKAVDDLQYIKLKPLGDAKHFTLVLDGDGHAQLPPDGALAPDDLDRIESAIRRAPVYDILRGDLEAVQKTLNELKRDESLQGLIERLKSHRRAEADREIVDELYQDSKTYRNILMYMIVEVAETRESFGKGTSSIFVIKQLDALLQRLIEYLADEDMRQPVSAETAAPPPPPQKGRTQRVVPAIPKHVYDQSYGYICLLALSATYQGKDGGEDTAQRRGARHALGLYLDYYKPPLDYTDAVQRAILLAERGQLPLDRPRQLTASGFPPNTRINRDLFALTWQEFVSAEVFGGVFIAGLLALAMSLHNAMNQYFWDLRVFAGRAGTDPMLCWLGTEDGLPLCTAGLLINAGVLGIAGWFSLNAAVLYNQRDYLEGVRRGSLELRSSVGLVLIALVLAAAAVMTWQAGPQYLAQSVLLFGAYGLITLPTSILFLAATGWSSVTQKGRRTRIQPLVGLRLTLLAVTLCLGTTVMLLFLIVEKSREHYLGGLLFGAVWGAALGLAIWIGRNKLATRAIHQLENETAADSNHSQERGIELNYSRGPIFSRLIPVVLISCVFALAAHWGGLWPNDSPYFAVPEIIGPDAAALVSAGNFGLAQGLTQFFSLMFFACWVALAYFIGLEMINHKMHRPGDPKKLPTKPDSPAGE
jgi:hypothetical protein